MEEIRNPSEAEVRSIMNEVYNVWFMKYKHAKTTEEFQSLIREAHSIKEKYPFKLTEVLILELLKIIESYYKEGNNLCQKQVN